MRHQVTVTLVMQNGLIIRINGMVPTPIIIQIIKIVEESGKLLAIGMMTGVITVIMVSLNLINEV